MPVSKAVQLIKCNTSRVMKRRLTFLKRMYADRGVWGEGYYVGSTGRDIRAVGQYIERQGGNALAKPVFPEYRPHYFLPRPGKHSQ
jgi:REP element-mobilizing transposase RayT